MRQDNNFIINYFMIFLIIIMMIILYMGNSQRLILQKIIGNAVIKNQIIEPEEKIDAPFDPTYIVHPRTARTGEDVNTTPAVLNELPSLKGMPTSVTFKEGETTSCDVPIEFPNYGITFNPDYAEIWFKTAFTPSQQTLGLAEYTNVILIRIVETAGDTTQGCTQKTWRTPPLKKPVYFNVTTQIGDGSSSSYTPVYE